ncbi:MAG: response regulator transcription factor [Bacilli bacterium]|nr:response regulator transcription factor [Bacilli bacterium]
MHKILIVEDDETIRMGLKYFLENEHFEMMEASNIEEAKFKLDDQPDLILLDLGLPDGNGFDLFEMIKQHDHIPTIFLTAVDEEVSIVRGLDMGADDYVTKPFKARELLSRINNVLRRYHRKHDQNMIRIQNITIDLNGARVRKGDIDVMLTALEYRILLILGLHPGKVYSREQILADIWDTNEAFVNDNTLTVYIKRIREKIEDDPNNPKIILTVRGLGYKVSAHE